MKKAEIEKEIKNLEWFIKNTSPTWEEIEFFNERITILKEKINKDKNEDTNDNN